MDQVNAAAISSGAINYPGSLRRDRMSTIEAGDPVPWTKPEDIRFDREKPLPKLAGPHKNVLNILFADGSVIRVAKDVDEKELRKAIDPADGQIGDLLPKREKRR
jgi:prepilin-type processing-associated H-X9-DG protein